MVRKQNEVVRTNVTLGAEAALRGELIYGSTGQFHYPGGHGPCAGQGLLRAPGVDGLARQPGQHRVLRPEWRGSLLRQTSDDFCWLIVDDGSTDHTKELVEQWQQECEKF